MDKVQARIITKLRRGSQMGSLDNLPIKDIFSDSGFAKINGTLTCYGYDPKTGVHISTYEAIIIKNSGLPASCTFVKPPEEYQGTLVWNGLYWYDNLKYNTHMEIQKRLAEFNRYTEDSIYSGVVFSNQALLIKEQRGTLTRKEKSVLANLRSRKAKFDGYDPYDLTMPFPFPSPIV